MATGQDLVNAACTFIGEPYSTAPGRDNPYSGFKDCSGLIAASYLVATGSSLGANVSVTIYDLSVRNGLAIPFDIARNIAGACLLMPEDPYQGWGPAGHIGFSDGNGGTVEATPPRVQRLSIDYQPWGSHACLLPGIDYFGTTSNIKPWSDDMIYFGQENGTTVALAMQGNVIVAVFDDTPGAYGIPQSALDYSANQIPIRLAHPLVLAKLRKADARSAG